MERSVHVLKFGGTSVGSGERIRHVAGILASFLKESAEAFPVVVVSAMSGITDQLLRIARAAYTGQQEPWQAELAALKQRHIEAAREAIHGEEARVEILGDLSTAFERLEQDISGATRRADAHVPGKGHKADSEAYDPASWALHAAAISAWGERLSVLLVAAAGRDLGLRVVPIREEVIITTDVQHETLPSFGTVIGADPLQEQTRINAQRLVLPWLEEGFVPIAPGFIGRAEQGIVTTLGRNGSDYSATVIGEALDCVEVTIYTDVDGVLSADPRIVANARLLPHLSYAEAARLSWFGAKVLHPRTLIPVAHRNIPVRVRNTFRPHTRGTVIGPVSSGRSGHNGLNGHSEHNGRSGAAAITVRRNLALITVENTDLFGAAESAGQVFALAARAGAAPVAICSSSGQHLAFVVEEQAVDSVVALLQHDMGSWRVRALRGLAACACIGSGFTADPMSSARAVTALARERIPVITQGASETGIILIVEERDSELALRSLHRDLIAPVIPLVRHDTEKQEPVARRGGGGRGREAGTLASPASSRGRPVGPTPSAIPVERLERQKRAQE
ncbi:MAG TPA: aspartate kinase [Ktedonobacteraceae bacterium]|nr:aspartate kinase [Ktedonobacteraceae bacterium]